MKKNFFFWMAAIVMLIMSSCQQEAGFGTEATVSFQVGTPEIATRAYSDGATATVLQYAVYDENGQELTDLTVTNGEIHGSTTVNLQLTTGNTYSVIFWAAAPNAPYTVDFANKTMTVVDYSTAVSNDEKRDAFYKYHTFTVTGAQTEIIELRRPFAQLNIGTSDYAASKSAGYEPKYSSVKVSNVYKTLDLVEGEVSDPTAVVYSYNAIPTNETFPVAGYEYLAMNYLLVDSEKEVVDVEFGYTELDANAAKTRTVGSVPVQRNHRTNIYGQLLTSDVDVNVIIEPEYEEPAYEADALLLAAAVGGEVTLTEDVELTEPLVIKHGVIINLDGHTITGNWHKDQGAVIKVEADVTAKFVGGTISSLGENGGSAIQNSGIAIVEGTTLKGAPNANGSWPSYTVNNTGNLTINNATITSYHGAVASYNDGAVVTLNNSVIDMNGIPGFTSHGIYTYNNGKVIVNGGNYENKATDQTASGASVINGAVTVNGGDFSGRIENYYGTPILKGGSYSVEPKASFIAAGYKVIGKDGRFYVVEDIKSNEGTDDVEEVVVNTADELTNAIANATEDVAIFLGNDIVGNVTALQKENVKVTVIGNGKKFNGTILVNGQSARFATTGLTIQGVEFVGYDNKPNLDAYINLGAKDNSNARYTNNVTIKDCTFAGVNEEMVAVKSYEGGDLNLQVIGCTVNAGMHSLLQVNNVETGLKVEGCEVYSKNGINLNNTPALTMKDCTFDVQGYAVRVGVNGSVNTEAKTFTISNSNLKSACAESDDAVIVIRQNATYATLNLAGTTLVGTREILGETTQTTINR